MQLAGAYAAGRATLQQLVLGMVQLAGRDAVLRSVDLSEAGLPVRCGACTLPRVAWRCVSRSWALQ